MKKSIKFFSSSPLETKRIAKKISQEILKEKKGPLFLILKGPLGAGKTLFVKALAKNLGIKERISSPSFIIFKRFKIKNKKSFFKYLFHFDLYRIKNFSEIKNLNLKKIFNDPQNLIILEWGEKIKRNLLKKRGYLISFKFTLPNQREIRISRLFC
jgi:tRNA threonylcarbamoyladenosine biosynthesis protein TsaE